MSARKPKVVIKVSTYRIDSRIVGTSQWQDEGSGDTWDTEAEAVAAMAGLEGENDDGQALEYRVVEVSS